MCVYVCVSVRGLGVGGGNELLTEKKNKEEYILLGYIIHLFL